MNPLRFFRNRAIRKEEEKQAVALFQERLHHALLSGSSQERKKFIFAIQRQIWETEHLLKLSTQAKKGQKAFIKMQCDLAKDNKIKTLEQVGEQSVFFQLLGVARGL